ncbi:hypothetical protein SKAU_G00125170 [Synaphobranchus kaupii]|uniref:Uncharacterized protein n=1 Tax=Synaphobranchus kaupii TaxID=118154 RepID=A0A9Q1FPA9_SYNKA|nr:hypothetical protein SKAU_G00125170 [Synaphobranchus kaupii]
MKPKWGELAVALKGTRGHFLFSFTLQTTLSSECLGGRCREGGVGREGVVSSQTRFHTSRNHNIVQYRDRLPVGGMASQPLPVADVHDHLLPPPCIVHWYPPSHGSTAEKRIPLGRVTDGLPIAPIVSRFPVGHFTGRFASDRAVSEVNFLLGTSEARLWTVLRAWFPCTPAQVSSVVGPVIGQLPVGSSPDQASSNCCKGSGYATVPCQRSAVRSEAERNSTEKGA